MRPLGQKNMLADPNCGGVEFHVKVIAMVILSKNATNGFSEQKPCVSYSIGAEFRQKLKKDVEVIDQFMSKPMRLHQMVVKGARFMDAIFDRLEF